LSVTDEVVSRKGQLRPSRKKKKERNTKQKINLMWLACFTSQHLEPGSRYSEREKKEPEKKPRAIELRRPNETKRGPTADFEFCLRLDWLGLSSLHRLQAETFTV
jgi:hypothetical protein